MEVTTNFKQPRQRRSGRASERAKWHKELKRKYGHITACEWPRRCTSTLGLAPAHSLKKRRITSLAEYLDIAMLCVRHHHYAEYGDRKHKGTHRRMFRLIRLCIKNRSVDELP